jgi:hypothetical protein
VPPGVPGGGTSASHRRTSSGHAGPSSMSPTSPPCAIGRANWPARPRRCELLGVSIPPPPAENALGRRTITPGEPAPGRRRRAAAGCRLTGPRRRRAPRRARPPRRARARTAGSTEAKHPARPTGRPPGAPAGAPPPAARASGTTGRRGPRRVARPVGDSCRRPAPHRPPHVPPRRLRWPQHTPRWLAVKGRDYRVVTKALPCRGWVARGQPHRRQRASASVATPAADSPRLTRNRLPQADSEDGNPSLRRALAHVAEGGRFEGPENAKRPRLTVGPSGGAPRTAP